jgi:DNA polymerase (family 10)
MSIAINQEVARVLQELVDLTKLDEGSPQAFRVRAYEKAASAVRDLASDLSELSVAEMVKLDGIGKSTADKIREYLETGTMAKLEKLRAMYPPALVELTRIPGMGPKTVLLVRDKLGVEDLDGLKAAIAEERLRDLPGLGAKSEEKIARAIERLGLHGKERRTPIIEAMSVARELVDLLGEMSDVTRVEYAGSLRRLRETIGDVDILAASSNPGPIMERFVALPLVREVIGHGETKSSILTGDGLQVDLRVVAPSEYGAALMYFTGSKAHNIELRQRAIDRGWLLNEYALKDAETDEVVASRTEKSIYRALDLPFIAPPMREGSGEVQAADDGALPRLVEIGDLRGDLHVHSTWSGDGRSSLEDMIAAAAANGLDYVAITEHGEDLSINGLSRDEVAAERKVVARLRKQYPDLTILHGAELNIGPDGGLDYDRDFLLEFDWCVASVHSHFDLPASEQTARIIAAMEHPAVGAIGHLTGRMIGRRPGIELDADAVFAAAVRTKTAIEINCHLDRLDCPPELLRRAGDYDGLLFTISTDAHHVREYANRQWGVLTSQRGWVDRKRVVNSWRRDRFLKWAAQKR